MEEKPESPRSPIPMWVWIIAVLAVLLGVNFIVSGGLNSPESISLSDLADRIIREQVIIDEARNPVLDENGNFILRGQKITDEDGDPALDDEGNAIFSGQLEIDGDGNPVLDSEGNFVLIGQAVADEDKTIRRIEVNGNKVAIELEGDESPSLSSVKDEGNIFEQMLNLGVPEEVLSNAPIFINDSSGLDTIVSALFAIGPVILLIWIFSRFFRQMQGGGGGNSIFGFGRSKARTITDGDKPTVTFEDVAGVDEAKEEVQEIVQFLKEPERFIQVGARIPKGVLMIGPPGTGKTLLARAIAGEAGVPFFSYLWL